MLSTLDRLETQNNIHEQSTFLQILNDGDLIVPPPEQPLFDEISGAVWGKSCQNSLHKWLALRAGNLGVFSETYDKLNFPRLVLLAWLETV